MLQRYSEITHDFYSAFCYYLNNLESRMAFLKKNVEKWVNISNFRKRIESFKELEVGQDFYNAYKLVNGVNINTELPGLKLLIYFLDQFGYENEINTILDSKLLNRYFSTDIENNISSVHCFYRDLFNSKKNKNKILDAGKKLFPFPTILTRNIIFTVGNVNKYTLSQPITINHYSDSVTIAGKLLSAYDIVVLSALLYFARKNKTFSFECSPYAIAKALSKNSIFENKNKIDLSLENLSNASILSYSYKRKDNKYCKKTFECTDKFNLITYRKNKILVNNRTQTKYFINIADFFSKAYSDKHFTLLDLDIFSSLKRPISKALYIFLASQEEFFIRNVLNIDALTEILNINIYDIIFKGFYTKENIRTKRSRDRANIIPAIDELISANILLPLKEQIIDGKEINVRLNVNLTNPYLDHT